MYRTVGKPLIERRATGRMDKMVVEGAVVEANTTAPTSTTEPEIKRRKRKSTSSSSLDNVLLAKAAAVDAASAPNDDNDSSSIIPLIPSNFRVPPSLQIHNAPPVPAENGGDDRTSTPSVCVSSASSVDESAASPTVATITCGYFSAKLHMDKFYCPGIHQLCIEHNDTFMSPKQFTIMAGKDKQKDWKAAIKLNNQPMRVLFEKRKIDFYKHLDFCSGRCVSKVIKPIEDGGIIDPDLSNHGETTAACNGDVEEQEYKVFNFNGQHQQQLATDAINACQSPDFGDSTIYSDPDTFWTAVYQLGIFYELTQEIDEQFNVLRTCFKIPEMRSKAAHKLSELVKVMDLKDKIHARLVTKRSLTKAQSVVVDNELSELKKIAENQEKKQREIKRKSEILDQLIGQAATAAASSPHNSSGTHGGRCVDLSVPNPLPSP